MSTLAERRAYGLEVWRGVPDCRDQLIRLANEQSGCNVRYSFRGYRPGPGAEPMVPAPLLLEWLGISLSVYGVATGPELNTARVKYYDPGITSGALEMHQDPAIYHVAADGTTGRIVLYTLSSLAVLRVRTPGGKIESFACEEGTVVSLPATLEHCVTPPLDGQRRYLVFIGFDATLLRRPCGYPEGQRGTCAVGHLHA
jgi:hypothetical protein